MLQISHLRKELYHIRNIDGTDYSEKVFERKKKLDKIAILLNEGCAENIALEAMAMTRSTYYRWKKNYKEDGLGGLEDTSRRPNTIRKPTWSSTAEKRVYHLRKKFPLWGKQKIAVIYNRNYQEKLSESTIGRILTRLIEQGKIKPVRFFLYGKKEKKKRVFNGHAQRWNRTMKADQPGELIQVDHMTTIVPGFGQIKHFTAICPVSKWTVFQSYRQATSSNAANFLKYMQDQFPFSVLSIQVDGGSEFMADFEVTCSRENIPLFVLPPRSPECNGNVERANGTAKYEFYAQYDAQPSLHMIRRKLQKFANFYNFQRPHQGLDLLTPNQFYEEIRKGGPRVSYVLN